MIRNSTLTRPRRTLRQMLSIESNTTLLATLLIAPSLILTLGLVIWPVIQTLNLSFTNTNLARPDRGRYIGLDNYVKHLTDDFFWETVRRTSIFTFASVGLEIVLGIAIALLIAERLRGWKFFRVAIIIPWAVPTVVNAAMWRWIFNADYGALNGMLLQLGLIHTPVTWLGEPRMAMGAVIFADIWHTTPFVVLIISAALASLPVDIYDAASIDGAGMWQRFWCITLPLLRPSLLVVLVVRTVEAFRVFDIIYTMTRGGPVNGTMVISYMTYEETFRYLKLGSGAALSFLVSIFILALALVYIRILHTEDV